jgi:hypothetical protein
MFHLLKEEDATFGQQNKTCGDTVVGPVIDLGQMENIYLPQVYHAFKRIEEKEKDQNLRTANPSIPTPELVTWDSEDMGQTSLRKCVPCAQPLGNKSRKQAIGQQKSPKREKPVDTRPSQQKTSKSKKQGVTHPGRQMSNKSEKQVPVVTHPAQQISKTEKKAVPNPGKQMSNKGKKKGPEHILCVVKEMKTEMETKFVPCPVEQTVKSEKKIRKRKKKRGQASELLSKQDACVQVN